MYLFSNMQRRWAARMAITLGLIVVGADARANLVAIEYWDEGIVHADDGGLTGGPLWTGEVDTVANTLTIRTWQEYPLHGSEFWVPRDLPLVWPARDTDGNLFDVPDDFAGQLGVDGQIGDFAFISDVRMQDILWKMPVFDYDPFPEQAPEFQGYVDVTFTFVVDVWPGWGGYAVLEIDQDTGDIVKAFHTTNPSPGTQEEPQPVFDEHMMPALPVQPPTSEHPSYTWSTDAAVKATLVPPGGEYNTAVPEARQWLALSAALLAALAVRWFTWRRRAEPEHAQ